MKLDIELNLSRTVEEALKFAVYKYKMEEKTSREIRKVEYILYEGNRKTKKPPQRKRQRQQATGSDSVWGKKDSKLVVA